MKLRFSPTSPFVRKVVVMAKETGIEDKIEKIKTNPLSRDDVRNSPNPLGKVPCLETEDGQVLYDSPVILDYLDGQHAGPKMIPQSGPARWTALRRQALGDGMLEAGILCFVESMRKPERQSQGWIAHNKAAIDRAIDQLEREADDLGGALDAGKITVGIALAFVDQTFKDDPWRETHPKLAAWFAEFNARPSMTETVLVDPRDYR